MVAQVKETTGSSIELELKVSDSDLFFVQASGQASCTVTLVEMVHRSDGRLLEYFTVKGTSPERVLEAAADATAIDDARFIGEEDSEARFEFIVSGPCIAGTLADTGAVIRHVVAVEGVGTVVAVVPPHADVREVVETVRKRFGAELVARRERNQPGPEFGPAQFRAGLADHLTERQLEALRTAYASGYFSWPRESTAEECAEALGVAQPTFTQHIRAGERKLMRGVFGEPRPVERGPPDRRSSP